jgi:predicted nucleic acid-binding protein
LILPRAVLADTSVWIDHLRSPNAEFAAALEQGSVYTHPFVIGELACGRLPSRASFLGLMRELSATPLATHAEVLHVIESHQLMGRGIGYADASLLASAALAGVTLWTRDQRIHEIAGEMGLAAG